MQKPYKPLAILFGMLLPISAQASDCGTRWNSYRNTELGVAFCHPNKLIVQTEGQDIYVLTRRSGAHAKTILSQKNRDLLFNGKRILDPNDYVVHIKMGRGDLIAANSQEKIFFYDKGAVRAGIGRFDNLPAKIVRFGGWSGYQSEIICGTSDPITGFHAAGGQCLWVIGSDGQNNFVLDTLGDPSDVTTALKIVESLRMLQAPVLIEKAHGRMSTCLSVMFMG